MINPVQWMSEALTRTENSQETVQNQEDTEDMGRNLFNTDYTEKQLEEDLEYHRKEMKQHEAQFQNHSETRKKLLEKAAEATGLKRKRLLLDANQQKKKAYSQLQKFFAHFEKYEQKMDWETVSDVTRIQADEDANIPVTEVSGEVADFLNTHEPVTDDVGNMEMEQAIRRTLEDNDMADGLEEERQIVRQLEKGQLSEHEIDLEMQIDEVLEPEHQDRIEQSAVKDENGEYVQGREEPPNLSIGQ